MMLTVINANVNSSNDRRMTWSLRYGWFGDFTIDSRCAANTRGSNSRSDNIGEFDVAVQTASIPDCIGDQTAPIIYVICVSYPRPQRHTFAHAQFG